MLLPEVSITLDTNQQPAAVIRDALSSARLVPRLALHLGLREADTKDCSIFQRSSLLCPSFFISSTPLLLLRWRRKTCPKLPEKGGSSSVDSSGQNGLPIALGRKATCLTENQLSAPVCTVTWVSFEFKSNNCINYRLKKSSLSDTISSSINTVLNRKEKKKTLKVQGQVSWHISMRELLRSLLSGLLTKQ